MVPGLRPVAVEPGRQEGDAAHLIGIVDRPLRVVGIGHGAQWRQLPVEVADIEDRELAQGRAIGQHVEQNAAARVVRPQHVEQESGGRRHVDRPRREQRRGRDLWPRGQEEPVPGRIWQIATNRGQGYRSDCHTGDRVVEPVGRRQHGHDVAGAARVQGIGAADVAQLFLAEDRGHHGCVRVGWVA